MKNAKEYAEALDAITDLVKSNRFDRMDFEDELETLEELRKELEYMEYENFKDTTDFKENIEGYIKTAIQNSEMTLDYVKEWYNIKCVFSEIHSTEYNINCECIECTQCEKLTAEVLEEMK